MIQLINNVHENGEWPKDFTEVTIIALKTKKKVAKRSNYRTVSLIAHTENTVLNIHRYCNWDTENNIRKNLGHRLRIVCWLHRLAAGLRPCKLE